LYDEGYTIEGARNHLKREGKRDDNPGVERTKELLHEIRLEIEDLLKLFP
jgi:hypothetical protein